jgi:hypothetical protein
MKEWNTITLRNSNFSNTYGGLSLVQYKDKKYLCMDDCFGPSYFGPLNQEEISAFDILCRIPLAKKEK